MCINKNSISLVFIFLFLNNSPNLYPKQMRNIVVIVFYIDNQVRV